MPKTFREQSRVGWFAKNLTEKEYPGHERVQIGCLQRIADATESMAQNFVNLQNERDSYKRYYENEAASVRRLVRSNNALRGVINRMKKTENSKS